MTAGKEKWDARIGAIYISSSLTMEREWHIALPDSVSFHIARISLDGCDATEQGLIDMLESGQVEEAARKLASAGVDVIAFGCTAGSFIKGIEWDRKLSKRIEEVSGGIPATTTSTGLIEALRALDCKNVALATPYLEEINVKERAFLEGNGFNVVDLKGCHCLKDQDIARVTPQQFIDLHKEMDVEESDCGFISCTNSRSIEAISVLEKELGKPFLSSNQVTLWSALKTIGYKGSIKGYGVLMESYL
ncbi:Asp/Glu racemase [Wukongibacter baidiensis]|uniref:maleate cis-trans isomerase family protein n=1 Tax=Wukongibacter baidiensis TaxID=1723361 RepID=UPI003D7FAD86